MKKNTIWRMAVALYVRAVIGMVLCAFLTLSIMSILNDRFGQFLMMTLNLIILLGLLYSYIQGEGDADVNRVNTGHQSRDDWKGLKAALIMSIPSAVAGLCLILARAGVLPKVVLTGYRIVNIPWMPILQVFMSPMRLLGQIPWTGIILSILVTIIVPCVFCAFGYMLGYRHVSITHLIVYTDPNRSHKTARRI